MRRSSLHVYFQDTKDTKGSDNYYSDLRALRVLVVSNSLPFGCAAVPR